MNNRIKDILLNIISKIKSASIYCGVMLFGLKKLRKKYEANDKQLYELINMVEPSIGKGLGIVLGFILFFFIWGGFAPLDSAVIAHGTIVPSGNLKIVQHLHGGIIEKILVKDGDVVRKGQELIILSKTQAKARLQQLMNSYFAKKIAEARIIAERDEKESFELYEEIDLENNPELEKIYDAEVRLFNENISSINGQIGIYNQQINIAEQRIMTLEQQLSSTQRERSLIEEELKNITLLYEKQLVQKTRLLNLERSIAESDIRIAEYKDQIHRATESINEVKLKIEQIRQNWKRDLSKELKDIGQQIASLKEEIDAAQDIETRTVITSPEDGIVTNMRFHTENGVIPPSGPIMEIVPSGANLIVEAMILPKDIDVIKEGQKTKIMITAFKARFVPRISGVLEYISADRIVDNKTGHAYYLARISINHDEIEKLGKSLLPGMPAEVFIVTGERTFLEYFLSPIINSLHRTFKEE